MTAEINVIVIGADPDKRLTQSHITNGSVNPGDILKEIIDVAINDLTSGYPTTTVVFIREALAFEAFYVAISNSHSKSLCLVDINGERVVKGRNFYKKAWS